MKYYIYVLKSELNGRYYIGTTNNIIRRLNEHNSGKSKSTCMYKPWKCIYKEEFSNISESYKRERYLKSLRKRSEIEKIINKAS
jgi:putative endonuclease